MTDAALRDRLAHARAAEPTAAEIAALHRALRRAPRRRPSRLRRGAALVLAALALGVPAAALAAGGFGDALDALLGTAQKAPPAPLDAGLPLQPGQGALVDEQGGQALVVSETPGGDVCVSLADRVRICDDPGASWTEQLHERAVAVLGTLPPESRSARAPVALFVLTARAAHRVEVRYERGAPTVRETGRGGAVVLVDAVRGPRDVVARDRSGAELGRAGLGHVQWRWCYDPAGCPEMNG